MATVGMLVRGAFGFQLPFLTCWERVFTVRA